MRFLIVDESSEFRLALAAMLGERWPKALVDEWDPRRQGSPLPALARGRYSAVLMDSHPAGEDGLKWVAEIRRDPGSPPVVLIADHGDTHVAIQALKAGASDFVRRTGLTPARLTRSLDDALREEQARASDTPSRRTVPNVPLDPHTIGSPAADLRELVPGYRVLRKIGEGGMGQVFLAEREHDGLQLVLKVLDPALRRDDVFLQRFVREYKLIASVEIEYVARIHDQGFAGRHPYIAMEYLSGGTLAVRMHEGMTSLASLRVVSQIARALDAIHGHGIVHRDLKPQNIMFRDNGRPVIVDFGLAKDLASDANLTRVGQVLATPRYMSPEQSLGLPVDHRSDLYSLGAIFYEMLSGKRIFESEGPAGLAYMHVHGEVPRLPARLAGYQTILDRLLAKRPEDRFQSARELFATIAV